MLAATNRADVLDAALMRPGRFDVQLHVPLPDTASRQAILEVHTRAMPLHNTVDLKVPSSHPCDLGKCHCEPPLRIKAAPVPWRTLFGALTKT